MTVHSTSRDQSIISLSTGFKLYLESNPQKCSQGKETKKEDVTDLAAAQTEAAESTLGDVDSHANLGPLDVGGGDMPSTGVGYAPSGASSGPGTGGQQVFTDEELSEIFQIDFASIFGSPDENIKSSNYKGVQLPSQQLNSSAANWKATHPNNLRGQTIVVRVKSASSNNPSYPNSDISNHSRVFLTKIRTNICVRTRFFFGITSNSLNT